MSNRIKLSVGEGYYLIALDDKEGKIIDKVEKYVIVSVIAAGVLELQLMEKITIKNGIVKVLDTIAIGNLVLDTVLKKLKTGVHYHKQILDISKKCKNLINEMNELLENRGVLRKGKTKFFWIPIDERMDNANYTFELELREGLENIVFKKTKPSESIIILFSLLVYTDLLGEVFKDKEDLQDALKLHDELIKRASIDDDLENSIRSMEVFFKN